MAVIQVDRHVLLQLAGLHTQKEVLQKEKEKHVIAIQRIRDKRMKLEAQERILLEYFVKKVETVDTGEDTKK